MDDDPLRKYRLQQPLDELKRKADKAKRKNFYTQEGLDYADVIAENLFKKFHEIPDTHIKIKILQKGI